MAPPDEKNGSSSSIVAAIRSHFEAIPEVAAVFLFGSQASGSQHPGSDVDIAVLATGDGSVFASRMQESYLRLSRILRMDVHLVVLNSAPAELIRQVLSKGQCVLNLRPNTLLEFKTRMISAIACYSPYREFFQRSVVRRIMQGGAAAAGSEFSSSQFHRTSS